VTVNVALVAPAATVTLLGTFTYVVLELDRPTVWPPVGAAPVRVTVPVLELPPATDVGDKLSALKPGVTVSVACWVSPPTAAVIVQLNCDVYGWVVTVKVAVVAPDATVTLLGTVTYAVSELDRETDNPPVGAAAVRVTVPVLVFPPTTVEGDKLSALRGRVMVSVACSFTVPADAVITQVYCDV